MSRRLADSERGSAIIMAIVLMTLMVGIGLAAYSFVDTQQVETTRERQRESSFNLAEAVLNSQSFTLSRRWAGSSTAYAATTPTCTQAAGVADQCPDPAQLSTAYNTPDFATGSSWKTTVYDDSSGPFYDSAVVEAKNGARRRPDRALGRERQPARLGQGRDDGSWPQPRARGAGPGAGARGVPARSA